MRRTSPATARRRRIRRAASRRFFAHAQQRQLIEDLLDRIAVEIVDVLLERVREELLGLVDLAQLGLRAADLRERHHRRRMVGPRLDEIREHRRVRFPVAALLQDFARFHDGIVEHLVGRGRLERGLVGGQRVIGLARGDVGVAEERLDLTLLRVAGVLLEPRLGARDDLVVLAHRVLAHVAAVLGVADEIARGIPFEVILHALERVLVVAAEEAGEREAVNGFLEVRALRELLLVLGVAFFRLVVLALGELGVGEQEAHFLAQRAGGLLGEHPAEVRFGRLRIVFLERRRAEQIADGEGVCALREFLEVLVALGAGLAAWFTSA